MGIADRTYLIFMSDNGWILGDHGFTSKVLPYLPSTHVPLAIVGPGISPSAEGGIALNIDLMPTILELTSAKIPANVHGESLTDVVLGKKKGVRDAFVYEGSDTYGGVKPNLTVVSGSYRFIVTYEDEKLDRVNFRELYEVDNDPDEMHNLIRNKEHASRIKQFQTLMDKHLQEIVRKR